MTIPVVLAAPSSPERYRRLSMEALSQRALDRLYERRRAVENLIAALERYQRAQSAQIASCVPLNGRSQPCSSGSVQ